MDQTPDSSRPYLDRRQTAARGNLSVNPHLFRNGIVTSNAHLAGDRMGISSALLQHTDPRVTEEFYNRGRSVEAAKKFRTIIDILGSE